MIVGYARTSTAEQAAGLEGQLRDLKGAGCERVYSEQVSSVAARAQMQAALDFVREGDVLIVTKPDRLARNTADLLRIVDDLTGRKVGLVFLSMGGERLDTRNPTSKLMLTMLGAVAEFERALMLERQLEGIAKAKAEGKFKGRPPTLHKHGAVAREMDARGVPRAQIARELGISRPTLYGLLQVEGEAA